MEEKTTWWNWLAIASFVLALVWGFFCMTLILLPFGILCRILAIIFGIVALCKKQTKWASIIWIIISFFGVVIFAICTIVLWKFIAQHKDQFITPITEFSAWIEKNPEIAALMEDEDFSDKFEETLQQRFQELYWDKYSDVDSIDWLMDIWWDMFEEMKNVATELAWQTWMWLDQWDEWVDFELTSDVLETSTRECECPEWFNEDWTPYVCNCPVQFLDKETCESVGWEIQTAINSEWEEYEVCVIDSVSK